MNRYRNLVFRTSICLLVPATIHGPLQYLRVDYLHQQPHASPDLASSNLDALMIMAMKKSCPRKYSRRLEFRLHHLRHTPPLLPPRMKRLLLNSRSKTLVLVRLIVSLCRAWLGTLKLLQKAWYLTRLERPLLPASTCRQSLSDFFSVLVWKDLYTRFMFCVSFTFPQSSRAHHQKFPGRSDYFTPVVHRTVFWLVWVRRLPGLNRCNGYRSRRVYSKALDFLDMTFHFPICISRPLIS